MSPLELVYVRIFCSMGNIRTGSFLVQLSIMAHMGCSLCGCDLTPARDRRGWLKNSSGFWHSVCRLRNSFSCVSCVFLISNILVVSLFSLHFGRASGIGLAANARLYSTITMGAAWLSVLRTCLFTASCRIRRLYVSLQHAELFHKSSCTILLSRDRDLLIYVRVIPSRWAGRNRECESCLWLCLFLI